MGQLGLYLDAQCETHPDLMLEFPDLPMCSFDRWATADGASTYKMQYARALLGSLPACQCSGGLPDPEKVDRFRQFDLPVLDGSFLGRGFHGCILFWSGES